MATVMRVVGWLFVVWLGCSQVLLEIRFWLGWKLGKAEAAVNPAYSALRLNSLVNHVKVRLLTLGLTGLVIWLLVR